MVIVVSSQKSGARGVYFAGYARKINTLPRLIEVILIVRIVCPLAGKVKEILFLCDPMSRRSISGSSSF